MKIRSNVEKRRLQGIAIITALSSLSFLYFGILKPGQEATTFGFVLNDEWVIIKDWVISSQTGARIFSIISLLASAIAVVALRKGRSISVPVAVASFGILMSFLTWIASGKFIPLTGLLQGGLLLSIPLIFGAMSGLVCERSGVINIAIEGQLLASAFVSAVVASLTDLAWWGLLAAPFAGAAISYLLATFAIKFSVDQVILGFVINVLVIGLTDYLYKKLLIPQQNTWNSPPLLEVIPIPILSKIPVVGPILFTHTIVVYLMVAIVSVVTFGLYKTKWGLRTRAVGEHPTAADTVGIDVNKLRFRNVIISGLIAGVGGAFYTVGSVGSFGKEMTAGAGFIALAALIFGKWSPIGALFAALLFGFATNLQSTLSIIGVAIPSEFMLMVPYIATIIAVTGLVGRVRAPAADGIPYSRGGVH
ncbi:MAG: ABC transporter permease [Actinobacteria bacterium]|nr:ABC transporter permease [Actinomycetota bacterium]MDA2997195.1 ABC transporter permease [Actinomycetota bacterium]